jgi:putative membrane protein
MRETALIVAVSALAVAWFGRLDDLWGGRFAAHMTAHMLLVAIASPLLAFGLANSRLDPVTWAPWLGAAIPASFFELAVVSAWHAPAMHHAARDRLAVFVAEQASFLAAGLWLWFAVLGGAPGAGTRRAASGVVALLLTFAHMTLLGALLALAPRPLYHDLDARSTLTPLADQQLGGAIMLIVGACAYTGGGLSLSVRLLRRTRAMADRS